MLAPAVFRYARRTKRALASPGFRAPSRRVMHRCFLFLSGGGPLPDRTVTQPGRVPLIPGGTHGVCPFAVLFLPTGDKTFPSRAPTCRFPIVHRRSFSPGGRPQRVASPTRVRKRGRPRTFAAAPGFFPRAIRAATSSDRGRYCPGLLSPLRSSDARALGRVPSALRASGPSVAGDHFDLPPFMGFRQAADVTRVHDHLVFCAVGVSAIPLIGTSPSLQRHAS